MDIIKQTSLNRRIHFFQNTNHLNWFLIKIDSDKSITAFYLKSRHLPPYEDSGYEDLPIEWSFALEFGDANTERYLQFIKSVKGIRHNNEELREDRWIGDWGWYEFTDIQNTDDWLNDFCDFQKQRYEELQKANRNGMQTAMF